MNTVKDLAVALSNVDWPRIQLDHTDQNVGLDLIRAHLLKMDKADAIDFLLEVMEAKLLNVAYPRSVFADMLKFEIMRGSYPSFKPLESVADESQENDHWYQVCKMLDTLARHQDKCHFGLPMNDISDLIKPVQQRYNISKKEL